MELSIFVAIIAAYYLVGIGFYALYWRYSEAVISSRGDRFIGQLWSVAWPVMLSISILLIPSFIFEAIQLKMVTRRYKAKQEYDGPPEDY